MKLKRYVKASLKVFNNKIKILMMTKETYLYDRFFNKNEILLLKM